MILRIIHSIPSNIGCLRSLCLRDGHTFLALLLVLALSSSCAPRENIVPDLHTGDLIFVADTTGMGSAVISSTGRYSHVAVVEHFDSIFVWEAVPSQGVVRHSLSEALAGWNAPCVAMRLDVPFDTVALMLRLMLADGSPYDPYFLPDNDRLYCSELVQRVFVTPEREPLFASSPMNFLDSLGNMPVYWEHLFDSLGVAVPQGVPGTNPSAMAAAPFLKPLNIDFSSL